MGSSVTAALLALILSSFALAIADETNNAHLRHPWGDLLIASRHAAAFAD